MKGINPASNAVDAVVLSRTFTHSNSKYSFQVSVPAE
jgi:hypothetical protein